MRLAALALVLAAASAAGHQRPRWAGFEGVSIGAPIDDLLALGGECRSADAAGELGPNTSAYWFSQSAFQYALPHYHPPRDSTAARVAMRLGTICVAPLFDARARAVVAAIDRHIVAIVVWFETTRADRMTPDSVRRIARVAWGRPTHPSPNLDTWWGARYRSYVLIPQFGRMDPEWTAPRVILLDIAACSAFERRVHRAGAQGEVGEC